jgi:protein tyrosine/serine phosphatase
MFSNLGRLAVVAVLVTCPVWAQDVVAGVNNFSEVNDHLYRGAQPSNSGFANLAKLGVKTVIDLRESGSRSAHEAELVKSLGMRYINIPLAGYSAPTGGEVAKILAILNDPSAGKVFIHCRRGADRTGTMIAIYRISHDHWDNRKALSEAESLKMAFWERQMKDYVLRYQAPKEAAPETLAAKN